jgi:hypothetical protein
MPAKLFLSVQFTTKTEPTPNDLLVLEKTRYQRNAVVQPLAAQLGMTLLFLPSYSPKPGRGKGTSLNSTSNTVSRLHQAFTCMPPRLLPPADWRH